MASGLEPLDYISVGIECAMRQLSLGMNILSLAYCCVLRREWMGIGVAGIIKLGSDCGSFPKNPCVKRTSKTIVITNDHI